MENNRSAEISQALSSAYAKASKLKKLSKAEEKALQADFNEKHIEILANGAIYLPHHFISSRLIEVFGIGQWSLICRETPSKGYLNVEHVMIVRGCFVGEDFGQADFNSPESYKLSMGGLAASATRRIAAFKLNCGIKLYQQDFIDSWIAKHAEQTESGWCKKGGKVKISETETSLPQGVKKQMSENDRDVLIQLLCGSADSKIVLEFAVERKILLPTETLADWPLFRVVTSQKEIEALQGEIKDFEKSKTAKKIESVSWDKTLLPFPVNKGKTLGDLAKDELASLWEVFETTLSMREKFPDFANIIKKVGEIKNFSALKTKRT